MLDIVEPKGAGRRDRTCDPHVVGVPGERRVHVFIIDDGEHRGAPRQCRKHPVVIPEPPAQSGSGRVDRTSGNEQEIDFGSGFGAEPGARRLEDPVPTLCPCARVDCPLDAVTG